MEAKFVDNLLNKVKFAGLGESKHQEIRDRIANNEPSFDVLYEPNFKHKTEAVVHIKRDDNKDDYYFNTYDVTLKKEGIDPIKQTVYTEIPKKDNEGKWVNSTITLKEAYNMMDIDDKGMGRSVLKDFVKDGERSQSWIRFDFTRKYDNGNYPILKTDSFDLDTYLKNSKIKDMNDSAIRKNLMGRLEKGDEANVIDGETVRGIVVNPQFQNTKFVTPSYGKTANEQKHGEANTASQSASQNATQNQATSQASNKTEGQTTSNTATESTNNNVTQGQASSQRNNNTERMPRKSKGKRSRISG